MQYPLKHLTPVVKPQRFLLIPCPHSMQRVTGLVLLFLLKSFVLNAQTTQTFTSSNSFIAAAGVTSLSIECWGGGGGGGNAAHSGTGTSRGGGGAGGAYSKKNLLSPSGAYTVTVGTGGTGSTTGGDSWFGSSATVIAKGGVAGGSANKSNGSGGAGTTAGSVGDAGAVFAGGNGATGSILGTGAGGSGAGSTGTGNNASLTILNGNAKANNGGAGGSGFLLPLGVSDGNAAADYGGGGGGASCITLISGSSATGGKGGEGLVTVTYTCTGYALSGTANTSTCIGTAASVTVSSSAANLPAGTYTVTYNLSSPNAATGNTATMTVSTAGTGTFNTAVLSVSGNTTITITNLRSGSGVGCSSNISLNNAATITVNSLPSIAGQPSAPAVVCSGNGVRTISVTATGSGISYSWRRNGSPVSNGAVYSGQGTQTLTLTNATASQAGNYDVVVSGTCSPSVTSTSVAVTVNAATSISSDAVPITQTKLLNAIPADLSIIAAGTSITYQWYFNTSNSNSGGTGLGAGNGAQTHTYSPSTSSEGSRYYYCVVSGTCGTQTSSAVTVVSTNTDIWLGGSTSDWSSNANWHTGTAPSATNHVIVPSGNSPYPALTASSAVNNLDIEPGTSIEIGSNIFTINGAIGGSGTITGSAASGLVLNGNACIINFTNSLTGNCLKNFTINSGASATLGNELNISAGESIGNEGLLTVSGSGILNTDGLLTIKSNIYGTASIAQGNSSGGYISGEVTIERYIPQNATKAWRILSTNTYGQTIQQAWQEGQPALVNGNAGYGIMITNRFATLADAQNAGFDTLSNSPSLYSFNVAANAWAAVTNTNIKQLSSEEGYYTFIRGDRSSGQFFANTAPVAPTVLRSKGTIYQGDQPTKTVLANKRLLCRNPYASAIDMRTIILTGGVVNAFYVWDPKLTGTSGNGAYQTLTKVGADYLVTPGGGSYPYSGSVVNTIESGLAFFMMATGTDGTVQILESSKAAGSNNVFRPSSPAFEGKRIITNLYADNSSHQLVDGNMVLISDENDNGITNTDVTKMLNMGESFSIDNAGSLLVVERKRTPQAADTILFNMRNLKRTNYQLEFVTDSMVLPGMYAYILDKFTGTGLQLNPSGNTILNFSVTSDSASFHPNRFKIVFRPHTVLPVSFMQVKVVKKDNEVAVEWKSADEMNVTSYEVERSVSGAQFIKIASVLKNNNSNYRLIDKQVENGICYYRIKAIEKNNKILYSNIVKVDMGKTGEQISISPNPVKNVAVIKMGQQKAGEFKMVLVNSLGLQVHYTNLLHSGGYFNHQLNLPPGLPSGIYQLKVLFPSKESIVKKVLVDQQ